MSLEEHQINLMRYADGEMNEQERAAFVKHIESCDACKKMLKELTSLKEVTATMKIAELPESLWDKYWHDVYNKLERSIAWVIFIIGSLIVTAYSIYEVITDPGINTIVGFGAVLIVVGFAILLLSVLREKITVNKTDKYVSEVKR